MDMVARMQERFQQYFETARDVRRKAPVFAGLFGLGSDPKKHPCHEEFLKDVGDLVAEFAATQPQEYQVVSVMKWLLEIAGEYEHDDVVWYLYALQGHVKPLIPLLTEEMAQRLADWYNTLYPRRKRLPLQDDIYRLLTKRGRGK